MSLLIVFLLLAFAFILTLWGGSLLLQGWLYQNPTDRLLIRAAVSGAVLAAFLTYWCYIDSRNPGKYDTLLEFSSEDVAEYDSFESVMRKADGAEKVIVFKKNRSGGRNSTTADYVDDKRHQWVKNTNDSMAVAIIIREKEGGASARFNANLDAKGNFPRDLTQLRYTDDAGRWITTDALGRVHRKKSGVLFANIFLNFFHFILWWAALWFGLRFNIWHAFGIAFVLWLFLMLAIQPVLFNQTRPHDQADSGMNRIVQV